MKKELLKMVGVLSFATTLSLISFIYSLYEKEDGLQIAFGSVTIGLLFTTLLLHNMYISYTKTI